MAKKDEFLKSMEMLIRKSGSASTIWEGTMKGYLALVAEDPKIAQSAPARIYDMIASKGATDLPESEKLPHYEDLVRYNFFSGEIFGIEESLHDLVRFLRAGANRTETGKRILILVGPVSSGKSTIATLLRSGLEREPTAMYAIKGCPIHEDPLHLIPRSLRPEFENLLGVKIEGDLCPVCKCRLEEDSQCRDQVGQFTWENMPVVQIRLSERDRVGIGTFQPSDPKNQDISELIGHVDLGKITKFGEAHPLGIQVRRRDRDREPGSYRVYRNPEMRHQIPLCPDHGGPGAIDQGPRVPADLYRYGNPEPHQPDRVRQVQGQQGKRSPA